MIDTLGLKVNIQLGLIKGIMKFSSKFITMYKMKMNQVMISLNTLRVLINDNLWRGGASLGPQPF